ncbi:MAG: branched-chain amino acid ABC transporter permease [Clostridiales bacterium]|nr:branched-chain amino acid ABC transporter permease [Clostridiales bacterium]
MATIPVLMGYLSVGIAFGILLQATGYGPLWAVFMSLTVYAGSSQFLECTLLAQAAALPQVALMTFLLNFRHFFYGLSLLDKLKGAGCKKPYLIFSLTDETYALLTGVRPPIGKDPHVFYLVIALLNQCYWVLGSFLGAALGSLFSFNTAGIDFAMTALFVTIAVDQWKVRGRKKGTGRLPALIGCGCTLLSLAVFGADKLLVPALIAICCLLLALRRRLDPDREEAAA